MFKFMSLDWSNKDKLQLYCKSDQPREESPVVSVDISSIPDITMDTLNAARAALESLYESSRATLLGTVAQAKLDELEALRVAKLAVLADLDAQIAAKA